MTCAILCALLWFLAVGLSTGDIFHQHLTKQVLLDLLDIAERELKVFIYPIPDNVDRYKSQGFDFTSSKCFVVITTSLVLCNSHLLSAINIIYGIHRKPI